MRYFSKGSIIADSREDAKMLMVITSGQVVCRGIHINNSAKQISTYNVLVVVFHGVMIQLT